MVNRPDPFTKTNDTTTPANKTPIDNIIIDLITGTLKTQETKAPVHAPVIGKGMATNMINSRLPYLWNLTDCLA